MGVIYVFLITQQSYRSATYFGPSAGCRIITSKTPHQHVEIKQRTCRVAALQAAESHARHKITRIGEDRVQTILNSSPSQKLDKNGDDYVLTTIDSQKTKELRFKNGVEFDETVAENVNAKTTFTVDGDVVKQVQKFPDGRSLFVERKYTDNTLVVTLKSSFWDGTAHRHYVAA